MFLASFPSSRRLRLHSGRTQRRLIFLLGGVIVGAAAVALALLADEAQDAFQRLISRWRYASLVVTPLGLGIAAYLTRRFFPNSQGSGIPQAIAARHLRDQRARGTLVSIRIAIGKILLTLFGLLCGASIGREGPTVQVGASIMFAIGRLSPRRQPGLILAGASAGVAAAFNTPLAGIVFGIEEMSRAYEAKTSGLLIGGIVAAGLTSLALFGDYTYFGTTSATLQGPFGWLAVPVCGAVGGLLGGVFSRILIEAARGFPGVVGRAIKRHPILFAMLCGLGTAICGLVSGDTIYGTGYGQVRALLDHGVPLPQSFGLVKMAATTLAAISGIPGGIFSPSLAIGAGIGFNLSTLFPGIPFEALILLGMVSYFAGVVQAPITAFVIVTEMTGDHAMVIPLMAAAFTGYAASRLVCHEGVYHALAKNFLAAVTASGQPPRQEASRQHQVE
ncbi:chloride channel protein [Paracraurococcus lichenis]|uniref:Chloride channel protein n=1 Tax=Paracraurococcus lichenis TaxID=3064888 RepID=A0ABT9DXG5_9PROT|nr:chloride channel protein [Paracraurococcus sp. LOR1-02]MDO9708480.1 chloride channel protein [Paracraurococcus sp. LOR1-02]